MNGIRKHHTDNEVVGGTERGSGSGGDGGNWLHPVHHLLYYESSLVITCPLYVTFQSDTLMTLTLQTVRLQGECAPHHAERCRMGRPFVGHE